MGALEQVMKMKSQGMTDSEISRNLQQQGVSPRTINDALSQAQVKSAIAQPGMEEEMQPSIMQQESNEETGQYYQPQTQEVEEVPQNQNYYPQQNQTYPTMTQEQNYYQPQESYGGGYTDTDTMIEISEQVFLEKIKPIKDQLEQMNEFKAMTQAKVENMAIRLKKIESTMDQLQIAILNKIGSYVQGIDGIKKEMSMMQDSMSKIAGHKRK